MYCVTRAVYVLLLFCAFVWFWVVGLLVGWVSVLFYVVVFVVVGFVFCVDCLSFAVLFVFCSFDVFLH